MTLELRYWRTGAPFGAASAGKAKDGPGSGCADAARDPLGPAAGAAAAAPSRWLSTPRIGVPVRGGGRIEGDGDGALLFGTGAVPVGTAVAGEGSRGGWELYGGGNCAG